MDVENVGSAQLPLSSPRTPDESNVVPGAGDTLDTVVVQLAHVQQDTPTL